jgi:hypothetical protein
MMKRSLGKKNCFTFSLLIFEKDTTNLWDTLLENVKKSQKSTQHTIYETEQALHVFPLRKRKHVNNVM